jgi:hypothetical protein
VKRDDRRDGLVSETGSERGGRTVAARQLYAQLDLARPLVQVASGRRAPAFSAPARTERLTGTLPGSSRAG